jgi:hypothetical protein
MWIPLQMKSWAREASVPLILTQRRCWIGCRQENTRYPQGGAHIFQNRCVGLEQSFTTFREGLSPLQHLLSRWKVPESQRLQALDAAVKGNPALVPGPEVAILPLLSFWNDRGTLSDSTIRERNKLFRRRRERNKDKEWSIQGKHG